MTSASGTSNNFLQFPEKLKPMHWGIIAAILAVICAFTWDTYKVALKNDFTNWDDPRYVAENEDLDLSKQAHWDNLLHEPYLANYHPLTMLSLAWNTDKKFPKRDPKPYIKTNILLHLANTILAFLLAYQLSRRRVLVGAITALWFAIHPMHVESVAWIAERKDVLYTFFFFGSLLAYWQYITKKHWLWLALTILLFVLSVLSKAMAIVLPIVMILMDYYQGRKFNFKVWSEKGALLIFSIVMGLIAVDVQRADAINEFDTFTIWQRFMFASYGFLMYLLKFFDPGPHSTFYPYPNLVRGGELELFWNFLPFGALLIIGLVLWSMRKTKILAFGFGFYSVTLVMVIQFISVGAAIMADRYTYVPYFALLFMAGMGFSHLIEQKNNTLKYIGFAIVGGMLVMSVPFASQSAAQIKIWKNPETLWTQVIDQYPMKVEVAYKNRGNYRAKTLQDYDGALSDYEALQKMKTKDPKVFSNLGNLYGLRGEFDKALASYDKAIEMGGDDPQYDVMMNRGVTLTKMRKFDQALEQFLKARTLKPNNYQVEQNLAYAYLELGQYANSVKTYDWLISQNPNVQNSYYLRGYGLQKLGQHAKALKDLELACKLNPKHKEAWYFAAVSAEALGDMNKTRQYGSTAQKLGQTLPAQQKRRWGL